MGKEHLLSTENQNVWSEYTRGRYEPRPWAEPSRARSYTGNPDIPLRSMHHMEYHRQYPWARPRYQDHDISSRTAYDRDNRTHVGWYEEDQQALLSTNQSNPDFKLAPTDVGGFRKLFTEECFRHIERRMREFGEFRYQATLLEEEVRVPLQSYWLFKTQLEVPLPAHWLTPSPESKQGRDDQGPAGTRHLCLYDRHGHIPPSQLRGKHLRHKHQGRKGHRPESVGLLGHGATGHGSCHLLRTAMDGRTGKHSPLGVVFWVTREQETLPTNFR
jgi:hypothetical protein